MFGALGTYWKLYGGNKAVLASFGFWTSLAITFSLHPIWMDRITKDIVWQTMGLSMISTLLAFSLGGMAIFLSFSGRIFLKSVVENGAEDSLYMQAVGSFFHAIFIQVLCIFLLIASLSYSPKVISIFAFFFMCWATILPLSIAGTLLKVARIFNAAAHIEHSRTYEDRNLKNRSRNQSTK